MQSIRHESYRYARDLDSCLAAIGSMIFVTLFIGVFSTALTYLILYYLVANAGP